MKTTMSIFDQISGMSGNVSMHLYDIFFIKGKITSVTFPCCHDNMLIKFEFNRLVEIISAS